MRLRPLIPIAATGLAVGAALALGAAPDKPEPGSQTITVWDGIVGPGGETAPVAAPTPPVAETIPAWKLVKAVRARDAARAEVRRLRRTLRHDPTVAEALTIASVAYGVPRSELSSAAWCESRHVATARNGRYRGLFQMGPIFEGTPYGRAGLSVWSPFAASMATAYIVRHGGHGWAPWECSPHGAFQP